MVGFVSGIVDLNCGFGIVGYYGKLKNTYSKVNDPKNKDPNPSFLHFPCFSSIKFKTTFYPNRKR